MYAKEQRSFYIAGTTNLYEVQNILKVVFPTMVYDTLSGFMIGQLGYIPKVEEQPEIEYKNILFTVDEMNDERIVKVRVKVKEGVVEVE
jgi:putative hemolysin